MGKRESAPEVNAGSMADIAFLLLIFFLVTTTIETDAGIDRMLPRSDGKEIEYEQRNILSVQMDAKGQIMMNGELIELNDLMDYAIKFIDNGGASNEDAYCDYCQGGRNVASSDNPNKAVIVVGTQRKTAYGAYITVQNELLKAYNSLRNREAHRLYQMDYTLMDKEYRNQDIGRDRKEELQGRIKTIQNMFPLNISEAQLKNQ